MDLNNMDKKEFLRRMDVYDIPEIYYADYGFYFDNVATNMQTQEHISYDWLYDLVFKRISQNSLRRDYIKMLNDLNWLFIKQPDSKIWQDAHYAVKKHANTIIIKFLNRELHFSRFQTLDAHLITTDLSRDSKTTKFIVFKDRLDLWLSEINPDSEYTLCKEIENDRIAQWIVRTSDLKMMKAGTDLNPDTDLGLYFTDHPDTQLVDLYRHILDLLK